MDTISGSSASALTRHQISAAIVSTAAVASIGYFFYRALLNPPPSEPDLAQGLHRSNAVRHRRRRRSLHEALNGRRSSDASSTDLHASPDEGEDGDENADLDAIRPLTDGETVEEPENIMADDWWNDPANMPPHNHHAHHQHQRAGQNIVSLLFRVSEDNARRNAYVHRGCECNVCGIVPIRGIRYRCANCADFDLCETCESQNLHTKTHIFYKVKVPGPPFGPRQMQPVWYPGDPSTCLRNLPRLVMARLSRETGFERPELEAFWEQWTFMANTEWREDPDDLCLAMDRKTFERCLIRSGGCGQTAPNLIHDRMFDFYDTNNDDLISFAEFLHGLSYRKRRDKLRKIFNGYDVDRDGLVSRRDFLRVFRAYYVLYKQMHKDILEGLDDQVMSSTDAHQLISGRQPISSLFGREGWIPDADDDRPLEGKMFNSNGDAAVLDASKGVVTSDKPDTSDRDNILMRLYSRDDHGFPISSPFPEDRSFSDPDSEFRYWRSLLNPATSLDELPSLLAGVTREGDELFYPDGADLPLRSIEEDGQDGDGQSSDSDDHEETANGVNHVATPGEEGRADIADEGDGAWEGVENGAPRPAGSSGDNLMGPSVPTESQGQAPQHQPAAFHGHETALTARSLGMHKIRIEARRKVLDRWKRRQFYLDEEEGGEPPEFWDDEDDVLARMDGVGSSSSKTPKAPAATATIAPHPISPRSRSSSKVRFAEDTDDYEIRSNPSTSSRSVPERWGGMEIPDAERDAGREILYQVTQQAFNELLDILFKYKEDIAVEAAETKALRDEHRPLFESIDLDEPNSYRQGNGDGGHGTTTAATTTWVRSAPEEPETDPREQTTEQLLRTSGYSVDSPGHEANDAVVEAIDDIVTDVARDTTTETNGDGSSSSSNSSSGSSGSSSSGNDTGNRDPTMPQFRPNSLSDVPGPSESNPPVASLVDPRAPTAAHNKGKQQQPSPSSSTSKKRKKRKQAEETRASESAMPVPVARETLVRWKQLDEAEKEARERGGWGLLTYDEFEEIYKREESQANRLDYLGSWIDFCIP